MMTTSLTRQWCASRRSHGNCSIRRRSSLARTATRSTSSTPTCCGRPCTRRSCVWSWSVAPAVGRPSCTKLGQTTCTTMWSPSAELGSRQRRLGDERRWVFPDSVGKPSSLGSSALVCVCGCVQALLQRAYRGMVGRSIARQKRIERAEWLRQIKFAASEMQRIVRGRIGRKIARVNQALNRIFVRHVALRPGMV